jgi:hypothetical protein
MAFTLIRKSWAVNIIQSYEPVVAILHVCYAPRIWKQALQHLSEGKRFKVVHLGSDGGMFSCRKRCGKALNNRATDVHSLLRGSIQMSGNSPKETALRRTENGPFQWFLLLGVIWSLAEAIRYIWLHS